MRRRRILSCLAVLLTVSMILSLAAGCAPRETAEAPPPPAPAPTPAEPVVLTFANTVPVPTIDPALMTDEAGYIAVINLYDPLLYPKIEEGTMEPGPHLATSWSVSEDGKVYRFNLRQGVKFHDGTELTAEDVAFTMDRMLALKKGPAWLWTGVLAPGDTKVVDRYTVEFHLKEPYAPFVGTLLFFFVVNKNLIMANLKPGDHGDFGDYGVDFLSRNDAGSGPLVLEKWEREGEFIGVRFTDYWKGWEPGQVDRFVYRTVPEEATVKLLIKAKEVDIVGQWLSIETYRELEAEPGITVAADPSVQLFHLPMNMRRPPLDDINFRLALVHAFDYETANTEILPGAIKAQGPVPLKAWGHNPAVPAFDYDMQKAKEYLAKSRYKPGEFTLQYHYVDVIPSERKIGLLLQASLAQLGINMEINPTPWVRLVEMTATPETTPHLGAFFDTLKYPHPDSHTWGMYHPSSHGSWRGMSWYDNPEVTRLLEQARAEVDVDRQISLYKEAQALITADVPSIYISNPVHRIAHLDRVKGYTYIGLIGYDLAVYHLRVEQ